VIEDGEWAALPVTLRRALASEAIEQILRESRAAVLDGGFDRAEAHLCRVLLDLDGRGLLDVARRLRSADDELARVLDAARTRDAGDTVDSRVVLLAFERRSSTRSRTATSHSSS
jgi:hypothetical protein